MSDSTAPAPAVKRTRTFWGHSFTLTPADEGNVWIELEGYHAMHWTFARPLEQATDEEIDDLLENVCLFNDIEPIDDEET